MNGEVIEGKALQYILIRPDDFTPDGSWPLVIMAHGFGANMYDLANLAPAIDETGYVYAFPNAPYPLEGTGGSGFSWLLGRPGVSDPPTTSPSLEEMLEAFTTEVTETTGTQPGNIVLSGFSQGGGLSLSHGLLRPDVFRGLAVLSGFFRDAELLRPRLPAERTQAIFVAHGRQDPIVAIDSGRATRDFLEAEGYAPAYHEYDMPHTIAPEVLGDLVPWLHATLPPKR